MLNERIGQYRITGKLGQGGMGEIFAAHDEKLNRTVAVKFIANSKLDSESSRRLFLREARAAAGLGHPFICTVHDVLEFDGQPVIIMEHVAGETLHARLNRGMPPVAEVLHYARELFEAIGTAHASGIVHRDIKPANIMITPSGHVKVMDFGLALETMSAPDEATARHSEENSPRIAGTLPYMPPEVLRGEGAGPASDMYAAGVVLYEMVTGKRPFNGNSDTALIASILDAAPAAAPPPLGGLIMRLLDRDPRKRPDAASALAELQVEASRPRLSKAAQHSLAVIPFRSITPDPDNAHLGLALADAITSELALVRSLIVRPTAAIIRYGDALADPVDAARELAVEFVVAGTFQRAASRLRVSVQLISASEARPLWSTKIDTSLDDIFAMQDDVSRRIVEALQVELSPADEERVAKRPHVAGDALDLYAKGRLMLLSENMANTNAAIDFLEKAHELDPQNPLPLAGLGEAYMRFAFSIDPSGDWYERAAAMAGRALALDPELPEARYLRAQLHWTPQSGFNHEYALRELASVIAERPNLSEAFDHLGVVLFHVGLVDEARAVFDHAIRINPNDNLNPSYLATCDLLRGRYQEALTHAEEALERVDSSWAHYMVAISLLHIGDLAGASKRLDQIARKFPGVLWPRSARAILRALDGDEAQARREIARTDEANRGYGHFHHAEFDIACALAIIGDHDGAITRLESVAANGMPCLIAVESETFFEGLRDHPRYASLVDGLRATRDYFRELYSGLRLLNRTSE